MDTVDAISLQTLAPDAKPAEGFPEVPRIAYVEDTWMSPFAASVYYYL